MFKRAREGYRQKAASLLSSLGSVEQFEVAYAMRSLAQRSQVAPAQDTNGSRTLQLMSGDGEGSQWWF